MLGLQTMYSVLRFKVRTEFSLIFLSLKIYIEFEDYPFSHYFIFAMWWKAKQHLELNINEQTPTGQLSVR